MRVTILSSLPPLKGISKYSAALLSSFPKDTAVDAINFKRMYPEFLYSGDTKDKSLKKINLPNVNVRTFLTWYNPLGWIYAGLTVKGDIVHAQWWSYVLAPVYVTLLSVAKFIRRKKIVITVHNVKPHEEGFFKKLANKSVFFLGDYFIVHSEKNKETFTENFSVSLEDVSVIPHGVLLPDAPISGVTKNEARSELKIPKEAKVLLFFGIIREYKGLNTLLHAFAKVKEKEQDAFLLIAGKPWEDWEKYQKIIDSYNFGSSVKAVLKFIPEDQIELYFKASDVVVLPYKHFDAQSGAGSLALPFRKPIVVTETGGLPQLIKDKRAIVRPQDSKELAKTLATILQDKKLQQKLGKDSASLSRQLSWGLIGGQTLKLYKWLLEDKNAT